MRQGKPIIYWDTCIFLAWLKDEKRPNKEMDGVNFIAHEIHDNHVILITSVVTKGEVLESTLDKRGLILWDSFFKRKNAREVVADGRIMQLTHDIRDYYQQRKIADGLPTLTLPDATHLATAIIYGATEFHTFDENDIPKRRRAILPLNGNVAGHPLKICKPPLPKEPYLF